jgi:uncharacterized protein (TIGR02117 family)
MRRWTIRLGAVLLVLSVALVAFAATAVITAGPGDPMLWPPRPGARAIEIAVVSNGYHAGIALPRAALAEFASGRGYPALIAVAERFAAYEWIEFGWGDREFYRSVPTVGDLSLGPALRALFRPGNASVLHVVGLGVEPARIFSSADLVRVPLSITGFDQLLARLDETFVPPRAGALSDLGPGLYGPSLFYPANGSFSVFRVCNHWIDQLLGAAGLPTTPVLATVPAGLFLALRWRAGLLPVARAEGRT